jgi:hypothetical protein
MVTYKNGIKYYPIEMTATQLTALKKKDLKLWEHITEIRAKNPIVEIIEET